MRILQVPRHSLNPRAAVKGRAFWGFSNEIVIGCLCDCETRTARYLERYELMWIGLFELRFRPIRMPIPTVGPGSARLSLRPISKAIRRIPSKHAGIPKTRPQGKREE
jgi:hypothetical protein